jgi:hypothetical protein
MCLKDLCLTDPVKKDAVHSTVEPTQPPTQSPTQSPIQSPTRKPTKFPTKAPTLEPPSPTHEKAKKEKVPKKPKPEGVGQDIFGGQIRAPKTKGAKAKAKAKELDADSSESIEPGKKLKKKPAEGDNFGAKNFSELVRVLSPAFLSALVLIIGLLVCSCCYCCEVGSREVEPNAYFNGTQRMARTVLPIFFIGYFCALILPPIFYGTVLLDDHASEDNCASTRVRWEAHALAAVAIFGAMTIDFVIAYTLDVEQNMPYFPDYQPSAIHILKNWPVLVLMNGLSRLDTYLDVCFVCIACHCHSSFFVPAAGMLGMSVFLTQLAPSGLAAFGAAPEGFRTVCKWIGLELSAEVMWVKAVRDEGVFYDEETAENAVLFFYGTSFSRLMLQGLPMGVMQLVFLTYTSNNTVIASVIVSLLLSVDTTIKWHYANCQAAAAQEEVNKSPGNSPHSPRTQPITQPTQSKPQFDLFGGIFGMGSLVSYKGPTSGVSSPKTSSPKFGGARGRKGVQHGKSASDPGPGFLMPGASVGLSTSSVLHQSREMIHASQHEAGFL